MVYNQVEFAVPMSCQSCVDKVTDALKNVEGIRSVDVDLKQERVVVDSSLSIFRVQSLLESTGKSAIITGVGAKRFASAVAVLGYPVGFTKGSIKGVVRFTEVEDNCVVDGTIDGLNPGSHGFHIHTSGDLSSGCDSLGDHYNPYNAPHGSPDDDTSKRHLGDLGNIVAGQTGRASFRLVDKYLKIKDLIGRSVAVTADPDDLGKGNNSSSLLDGNSGERLGCGIIARSAGVMENPKRICLCSGKTLWEENTQLVNDVSKSDQTTPKLMT